MSPDCSSLRAAKEIRVRFFNTEERPQMEYFTITVSFFIEEKEKRDQAL